MNTDTTGVYAIVNMMNGRVYIGATMVSFKVRWCSHKSTLKAGVNDNPHLQCDWNKYGKKIFEFMILEYVNDSDKISEREQYWLDHHRMLVDVYNIVTNTNGCYLRKCGMARWEKLGYVVTQEIREYLNDEEEWRILTSRYGNDSYLANTLGIKVDALRMRRHRIREKIKFLFSSL